MGAVFRATQLLSDRHVALKWRLHAPARESGGLRFLREAHALGRIVHPNVVTLYDICKTPEACCLVMELLHGRSLRSHFGGGPLPCRDVLDVLIPAMHGVAAAHRVGVIHRDLKPENIFLCDATDSTSSTIKVLDFGISRVAGAGATLTQAGTMLGSLAYMSPEQLEDPHTVDARADVYAFGIIVYEALAGKRPFEASSVGELLQALPRRSPAALSRLRPDLPRCARRKF